MALLLGGRVIAATRENVDVMAGGGELLGQLAHVTSEPALDDRRELPREDQDAHGAGGYRPAAAAGLARCENRHTVVAVGDRNVPAMVDGKELIRAFLEQSPFALLTGLEVRELGDDRAVLAMPFDEKLATAGQTIHGGAISTLLDTAATAAAWATQFEAMPTRWGTASLSVNFLRGAEGQDLLADATVVRRGRSLSYCTAEARDERGAVATAIIAYALT